jgi:hypothetical protein
MKIKSNVKAGGLSSVRALYPTSFHIRFDFHSFIPFP